MEAGGNKFPLSSSPSICDSQFGQLASLGNKAKAVDSYEDWIKNTECKLDFSSNMASIL